ncbi:cholinesterase precursor [Podospora conica]|nr:cholinesterase precursor [Schizothecium conicum]
MAVSTLFFVALALSATFTSALSAGPPQSCDPAAAKYLTVKTTNGPITGHLANNTACVVEYLGIPFVKPPVGDLRFAPPQRFVGKETFNAAIFGPDCPQTPGKPVDYPGLTPQGQRIINSFAAAEGNSQSEDCLTLNIWASPSTNAHKAKKPVLVFFYGGRFMVGNTNTAFYNGKYLADAEDIIVVTVNYRLNIFGFPGAPGGVQNLGLRDQRAAVEWVRDNIVSFGGDPSKVTISGQSSGGVGVDYWAYAYRRDPIAHGIIAPSGNAFSFGGNTKLITEANWNTVVAAVNCSGVVDTLACVRKVDWHAIKTAAGAIKPAKSTSVLRGTSPFWPTPDGELVFSGAEYLDLTANGTFARLPILYGNTDNEDGYYRVPSFANGVVPTNEQVTAFLLECFTCPASHQVNGRRNHRVPSYAYRFFADWNNTRLYPTSGAYHGVDMHMVFGGSEDVSGLPTTAEQQQLTKLMQKAWFAFAEDPRSGLERFGWPRFNPKEKTLAQLGLVNVPEAKFTYPSVYDAPCSTVTMGALGTPVP